MRVFLVSLWFCILATFLGGQANFLSIPFTSSHIKIDGLGHDWDSLPIIIPGGGKTPYQNKNRAALAWNPDFLFIIFHIDDHQLCVHESGSQNARIYLNDGVEIYLDTRADSDSIMDKNDYQFLIALPDASVVFRGDKFLLEQGHSVPKDPENHTVIFQKAITYTGTINNLYDKDAGFIVEAAIPWSTLGISPASGMELKIDLCVNDLDTLVDMASMSEDWHPASMNYINLQGKSDFGYPAYWSRAILTGTPGMLYSWKQKIDPYWELVFGVVIFLLLIGSGFIYHQFKKIQFYRTFPTRQNIIDFYPRNVKGEIHSPTLPNPGRDTPTPLPEAILALKGYIEKNLDKDISLEDMSRQIHVGIRQIQRLTKEYLGMSPKQWVNVMKMEEASKRLAYSSKTISEIAFELGYDDAAYFSQLFKKYHGLSPGSYRKSKM